MILNYHNLKEHQRNFRDVTGLKIEEFEKVVEKVRPEWEKKFKNRRNAMEERQDCLYWKIKYSV